MGLKIKFIIVSLVGFCIACLFLFMQATSQQQGLLRESSDLKTENTVLLNKAGKLENDLRQTQGRMGSLEAERDRGVDEINELNKRIELLGEARDELIEQLKKNSQPRVIASVPQPVQPPVPVLQNTDAYWGEVLKAKTDLEMQLSRLQAELKSLQISNEPLKRTKSVLEIDLNSLRNDKKDLLRQLNYNQKLLDSMSEELARERNDKVAIQDNLKSMRTENGLLSRKLKGLLSRNEVLDRKVKSLLKGKSTVEKRLNEMEIMLSDRISKIDKLKNELNALKGGSGESLDQMSKESVELPTIVVRSTPVIAREKAQVQIFPGKILSVNLDNNFVVIDLGSSAGVNVGDIFNVYRDIKSIGSIKVIQTRVNISACDIKRMNTPLKIGDKIK
ncbi:MAG: hypothetical protein V1670_03005 [Candidatus Omnitrophota bacterium]